MAVKMSMLIFWVVAPCGLVGRHQCFGEFSVSIFRAEYGESEMRFLNGSFEQPSDLSVVGVLRHSF
jgi:hypothetical protein